MHFFIFFISIYKIISNKFLKYKKKNYNYSNKIIKKKKNIYKNVKKRKSI